MSDKRKSWDGAMKGWATRRARMADRDAAIARLLNVSDDLTGLVVTGGLGPLAVNAEWVINWRDRITSAVRILQRQ